MLRTKIELEGARRLLRALALGSALLCGAMSVSAAEKHSSTESSLRFVSITRDLEQSPFKPDGKAERAWAVDWLSKAPDVTVNVCADPLGDLTGSKYKYVGEITVQYMFSMAVLIIEHPESSKNLNAQQLAGVEGALAAYRAILKAEPESTSPALDRLLQSQTKGQLAAVTRKAWSNCLANS